MKSLTIGQVIYVLSNKAQKIVPAIVVEEVVVKKLDGHHVSWKVSVGPAGKEKVIDSSRLDGDIYTSLDEIKEVLHKRLALFLNDIISEAEKRAANWYGEKIKSVTPNKIDAESSEKIDPDQLLVDIETPSVSNVVPMSGRQQSNSNKPPSSTVMGQDELRKRMADIADENVPLGGQDGRQVVDSQEVNLPDGQTVRVNIKI